MIPHWKLAQYCADVYPPTEIPLCRASEVEAAIIDLEASGYQKQTLICIAGTEFSRSVFGVIGKPRLWNLLLRGEIWSNSRDVIRDLRFYPVKVEDVGRVHHGFRKSALEWLEEFSDRLEWDIEYTISGHSKGGGEATQLAIEMNRRGYRVREIVNFGEPASCSRVAREMLSKTGIRRYSYLNEYDWIKEANTWWTPYQCAYPIGLSGEPQENEHDINLYVSRLKRLAGEST